MALARCSHQHAWLGWVALVPPFWAIRVCRPLTAAGYGALWGISLYAFSLAATGHLPGATEVGASLTLLTLIPALYTSLGAALTRWIGFSPLVLGVGWMAVELAFEPLGLHEGLLGSARGDWTLIDWIARAFGYILVAFLVAYVNACLLSGLVRIPLNVSSPYRTHCGDDGASPVVPRSRVWSPRYAVPTTMPRAPPIGTVGIGDA